MTDVDPFVIPIPRAFAKDNTPDEIEVHEYFRYLHRHLHDMWNRTGGGTDNVTGVVEVIDGTSTTLPDGTEPVWDAPDWQFFATR